MLISFCLANVIAEWCRLTWYPRFFFLLPFLGPNSRPRSVSHFESCDFFCSAGIQTTRIGYLDARVKNRKREMERGDIEKASEIPMCARKSLIDIQFGRSITDGSNDKSFARAREEKGKREVCKESLRSIPCNEILFSFRTLRKVATVRFPEMKTFIFARRVQKVN